MHVAGVNCDDKLHALHICSQYNIKGYPTILYFPPTSDTRGIEFERYIGKRTLKGFQDFMAGETDDTQDWRDWMGGWFVRTSDKLEALNDRLLANQRKNLALLTE